MTKALKSLIVAGVMGLASLASAATNDIAQIKTENALPKPYIGMTYVSDYVSSSGSTCKEKCFQSFISIDPVKDLNFTVWQNYSLTDHDLSERDYILTKTFPISSNLNAKVGAEYWSYPSGRYGHFDSVERASLNHSGFLDSSLTYLHINANSATENGDRVHLKVSKTLGIGEMDETKLSLTPSVSTAWLHNDFGASGMGHVTAGLSAGVSRGNWNANVFINHQQSLNSKFPNVNYGGVSAGYQF